MYLLCAIALMTCQFALPADRDEPRPRVERPADRPGWFPADEAFRRADRNRDGVIDRDEFRAAFRRLHQGRLDRGPADQMRPPRFDRRMDARPFRGREGPRYGERDLYGPGRPWGDRRWDARAPSGRGFDQGPAMRPQPGPSRQDELRRWIDRRIDEAIDRALTQHSAPHDAGTMQPPKEQKVDRPRRSARERSERPLSPPGRGAGQRFFERWDANRDGRVERSEFGGPLSRFDDLDLDGDGAITREEFGKATDR
jgi:hypothetical protein